MRSTVLHAHLVETYYGTWTLGGLTQPLYIVRQELVVSLTSLFSTNMVILETIVGQEVY